MQQRKALQGLKEAADLVKMVEDLCAPDTIETLSPASIAGMRITLQTVRKGILESYDSLTSRLVERTATGGNQSESNRGASIHQVEKEVTTQRPTREELRASLERLR